MDTQASTLTEHINTLDSTIVGAVLAPSKPPTYSCSAPQLKKLLGTDGHMPLDEILRKFNTYIWNNQLYCGASSIKLPQELQEALHLYEQTAPYSAVLVSLTKHYEPYKN
jgi:hypothetical protein